jgi:hypothetical protein
VQKKPARANKKEKKPFYKPELAPADEQPNGKSEIRENNDRKPRKPRAEKENRPRDTRVVEEKQKDPSLALSIAESKRIQQLVPTGIPEETMKAIQRIKEVVGHEEHDILAVLEDKRFDENETIQHFLTLNAQQSAPADPAAAQEGANVHHKEGHHPSAQPAEAPRPPNAAAVWSNFAKKNIKGGKASESARPPGPPTRRPNERVNNSHFLFCVSLLFPFFFCHHFCISIGLTKMNNSGATNEPKRSNEHNCRSNSEGTG